LFTFEDIIDDGNILIEMTYAGGMLLSLPDGLGKVFATIADVKN
jgi:hypothetical protein